MEINCETVVEKYLLNQNPLYAFSFPLSLLVAIIVFGIAKAYKWSENSYINQILIPILAFLLTMVLIDVISRMMIKKEEKIRLVELCKSLMNNPSSKNYPLLSKMLNNYKEKSNIESFSSGNFSIQDNIMHNNLQYNEKEIIKDNIVNNSNNMPIDPICEIPNISPFPLDAVSNGSTCIQNSNCCSLCSGTNDNPCNIIAPIPGPQWLPSSAESVQNNLKNNIYTPAKCVIK
jgi:phosphate/sulfate permease